MSNPNDHAGFATDGLKGFMEDIKPEPNMTVEEYAYLLFQMQMEYYSAHCMTDLPNDYDTFLRLSEEDRKGWHKTAKKRMKHFEKEKCGD